jgi:hypothetical protein
MLLRQLQPPTQTADDTDDADNFVAFVEAPPIKLGKDITPLGWWCDPTTRRRYPRLSRMAIAILSIPAESTEPERTFSGARRTCSWDRLSLTCSKIEIVECIGSWLREGHIRPRCANGLGLPIETVEIDADQLDEELAELVQTL